MNLLLIGLAITILIVVFRSYNSDEHKEDHSNDPFMKEHKKK